MRSISANSAFVDEIYIVAAWVDEKSGEGAAPNLDSNVYDANTGASYTASANITIKFYIDSQGYFHYFFNASGIDTFASYVNKLSNHSPSSQVSAVRYSANFDKNSTGFTEDNIEKLFCRRYGRNTENVGSRGLEERF